MSTGWYHQTYQTGEWDGFNDSGIEPFRDDPLLNLARETIQNSIDARLETDSPIIVSFSKHDIKTDSIPGFEQLALAIRACSSEKSNRDNEKADSFFANALSLIDKDKIAVLSIVDSNTTGIKGPCENETAYHAFIKAKGLSHKESDVASGSYGIGKLAPYAVSELRTVSTIYEEEGNFVQLTQGKTILTSHKNAGEVKSSIGFWGEVNGCLPLEGVPNIASWVLNSTSIEEIPTRQGTKLSILGFDPVAHWQEILACSVAENFFGAISGGDLIVHIGSKYTLDSDSLASFFVCDDVQKLLALPQSPIDSERFENASTYYQALTLPKEAIIESQTLNLKHCKLNLIVDTGLPKKVCILRNGMFITDSLKGLIRFSDFKDFVAVFQCDNDEGNKLLRGMEPATHTNFIPKLLPKPDVKKGQKALDEIVKWIKAVLRDKARDPVSDKTSLDELKDLLGDEDVSGSNPKGEEINPLGRVIYQGKPIKLTSHRPTPSNSPTAVDVDTGDQPDSGQGGGGGAGAGGGDGSGGQGGISGSGTGGGASMGRPVDLNNLRAPLSPDGKRKISFTPTSTGKISIRIYEARADVDYPVEIKSASEGAVRKGSLEVDCIAEHRMTVLLELRESFNGAIKVVANEI